MTISKLSRVIALPALARPETLSRAEKAPAADHFAAPRALTPAATGDVVRGSLHFERSEAAPLGFFEGTHRTEGERTPRDAQYRAGPTITVPRRADFAVHGLSLLERAGEVPLYDREVTITRPDGTRASINLMKAGNDTVPVDDFYRALEEILRGTTFHVDEAHATLLGLTLAPGAVTAPVPGNAVLSLIDATIAEAVRLADKTPPEAAPIPNESPAMREQFLTMLKRFAIQAVFHSKDLTTVHVAMGHDPQREPQLNETLQHDLVEPAPLKDLVWQLERRDHEPWMDQWLLAEVRKQKPQLVADLPSARLLTQKERETLYELVKLDGGLTFNCSALNPHNINAMFRWGDAREDSNVLIDPHRLSPHHNGSSTTDVDFQQRAINFLSHHMPREHMGIRHVQRGAWDLTNPDGSVTPFGTLEHALATDHAISGSTVLQAIAREGARFFRAAEERGFTVPWQKMKVPNTPEFVQLDAAYQALQSNNTAADKLFAKHRTSAVAGGLQQGQAQLLEELERLDDSATESRLDSLHRQFVTLAAGASTPQTRAAMTELGLVAIARMVQLMPASVDTTVRFGAAAERFEDALYAFNPTVAPKEGRLFIALERATELRAVLEGLPQASKASHAAGDSSTATVYRNWQSLLEGGLRSTAN